MTYIKRVVMTGFKSFGDRTVSVNLAKGFTCIIGPNGNGKSNVIDALSFGMGRISKKTMRAKSLSDLIFAGSKGKKAASKAKVTIVFDNKNEEFPYKSDEFSISRWVKKSGSSGYRMQGKSSTRTAILNTLAQGSVNPDSGNLFIMQGRIVELTNISTNKRREFIEELIGLSKFDVMINKTIKELERADKDLGQFEAIFKEVSAQLKKVEKEKNDALKWQELNEKIRLHNAQLIALKIQKLREEEETIEVEMESTQLIIEEMENKVNNQKKKIEAETIFLKGIEDEISIKENEKKELEEQLSKQKSDLSAKRATLKASKENLKRLDKNIIKLEEKQEVLEEGQTYPDLIKGTNGKIEETQVVIEETTNEIDLTIKEEKNKEAKIGEINNEKTEINKEISKVQQEIKALTTEIKMLTKSIKKNTIKYKKLEIDLAKLKKEGESIQEAIDATKEELNQINEKILRLRKKIDKQKSRQKEIDEELIGLNKKRDEATKNQSDIQATISSLSAEINMLEKRSKELEIKKKKYREEYERLTNGQKIENQIFKLKESENNLIKEIRDLKKNLKKANNDQKSSQNKKESVELKRRTLESEKSDIEKRISGLKVEIKNSKSELKINSREKDEIILRKGNLENKISQLKKVLEKNSNQAENITKNLELLERDRKSLQKRINKREIEQEKSSAELNTVMSTLQIIMQNVDRSAGNIKSDIQNTTQVAIDKSADVFKSFVLDITDMMKSIEEISDNEATEIKEELAQVVTTLNFLIENSDQPIQQINEEVKEASEDSLRESTEHFDGFIADFTDKFDSIRIALQAVAVSDNSELYKSLENLNETIQRNNNKLAKLNNDIAGIKIQLEQKQKDFRNLELNLEKLGKNIEINNNKIQKNETELNEKTELIKKNDVDIDKLSNKLKEIRNLSDNFWQSSKDIQDQIDKNSDELSQIQSDLNELGDVKRILENINDATKEQDKMKEEIKKKKVNINDLISQQEKVKNEILDIGENSKNVKKERDAADETRNQLQSKIDEENKNLNLVSGKLKDLENIQKIISDIKTLKNENIESSEKIELNKKTIEEFNEKITEFEEKIKEKNNTIDLIQNEREKLENTEKELRAKLKILNVEKNELDKKLDKQQQMQNRAEEIKKLNNEAKELEESIIELEDSIKEIDESISKLDMERSKIYEELTNLQNQKSESWEKQRNLQNELNEFNTELSKNKSKLNTLKTRKIVLEEKVDDLFEKSKDFGTLPIVTDDLAVDSLNQEISKASQDKKKLEPVNLKAIEEYDIIRERWDEIDMRRQTLQRERKAILDSIDRIELEKTRTFMKAYHEINRVFSSVFQQLSPGGSAKMILENPAHPFEEGINIEARPRGKKISSLNILSGGEKTLVALSFIFAVQNFYPAPFYIMDEIDAALDGPNVYRVSMVIKEYSKQAQFLVISHREENITNSDRIYGVAMNDGITDIFTVDLEEEKERDDFGSKIEGIEE